MTDGEALNSGNNKTKIWNEEKGNENKNKEAETTGGKEHKEETK
jgi:hypothetical protein